MDINPIVLISGLSKYSSYAEEITLEFHLSKTNGVSTLVGLHAYMDQSVLQPNPYCARAQHRNLKSFLDSDLQSILATTSDNKTLICFAHCSHFLQ